MDVIDSDVINDSYAVGLSGERGLVIDRFVVAGMEKPFTNQNICECICFWVISLVFGSSFTED